MSTEVTWVLDTIKANWPGTFPADLERVDRDESDLLEGDIRSRKGDLQDSNFVGATHANTTTSAIGTEYDHSIETVVGIRIEGMTTQGGLFGHVDPSGTDGIEWETLVSNIRRGLLQEREYPAVGADHRTYTDLLITNPAPQSNRYRDYYRHDLDVVLRGYETLP